MTPQDLDAEQIREAYARQGRRWAGEKYRWWNAGNLLIGQERERAIIALLVRSGMFPLDGCRVLDVGCGEGKQLLRCHALGASLDDLVGIDIVEGRIDGARRRAAGVDFRLADARELPFADGQFDLALAFMSFSSMVSDQMRRAAATEILRVLKPEGALLWYDFRVNPRNPDVTPLDIDDVRALFPGCAIDARRITLAPPIARRLAPASRVVCEMLTWIRPLRTHWLVLIRPQARTAAAAKPPVPPG